MAKKKVNQSSKSLMTILGFLAGLDLICGCYLIFPSTEWLELPVEAWQDMEHFKNVSSFIENAKVINDVAERAIKTVEENACMTKAKNLKQYLF